MKGIDARTRLYVVQDDCIAVYSEHSVSLEYGKTVAEVKRLYNHLTLRAATRVDAWILQAFRIPNEVMK